MELVGNVQNQLMKLLHRIQVFDEAIKYSYMDVTVLTAIDNSLGSLMSRLLKK